MADGALHTDGTTTHLLLLRRLALRRIVARGILDRDPTRAQRRLDPRDLCVSLGDAIGRLWRGKDLAAILRRLVEQVGQRAAVGREQGELRIDGVTVEGHTATSSQMLHAVWRSSFSWFSYLYRTLV